MDERRGLSARLAAPSIARTWPSKARARMSEPDCEAWTAQLGHQPTPKPNTRMQPYRLAEVRQTRQQQEVSTKAPASTERTPSALDGRVHTRPLASHLYQSCCAFSGAMRWIPAHADCICLSLNFDLVHSKLITLLRTQCRIVLSRRRSN